MLRKPKGSYEAKAAGFNVVPVMRKPAGSPTGPLKVKSSRNLKTRPSKVKRSRVLKKPSRPMVWKKPSRGTHEEQDSWVYRAFNL